VRHARHATARAEADEDDDAAAARDHGTNRRPSREAPGSIHGEPVHGAPAVVRYLLGGRSELTPRIVDHDVYCAETLDRSVDDTLDVIGVADVRLHGETAPSERLDLVARHLQQLRPPAADDDVGAAAAEGERCCPTDTCAASGDEADGPCVGVVGQCEALHGRPD